MRIDQTPAVGRAPRLSLDRPATMRDPTRAPIDVVVENLSETGALLRSVATLPIGTLVSLGIAGAGLRLARVVRLQPAAMAIEFMLPLEPGAVARAKTADTLVAVAFPQMMIDPATTARPAVPGARPGPAAPDAVDVTPDRAIDPRLVAMVAHPVRSGTGLRSTGLWLIVLAAAVVAVLVCALV